MVCHVMTSNQKTLTEQVTFPHLYKKSQRTYIYILTSSPIQIDEKIYSKAELCTYLKQKHNVKYSQPDTYLNVVSFVGMAKSFLISNLLLVSKQFNELKFCIQKIQVVDASLALPFGFQNGFPRKYSTKAYHKKVYCAYDKEKFQS